MKDGHTARYEYAYEFSYFGHYMAKRKADTGRTRNCKIPQLGRRNDILPDLPQRGTASAKRCTCSVYLSDASPYSASLTRDNKKSGLVIHCGILTALFRSIENLRSSISILSAGSKRSRHKTHVIRVRHAWTGATVSKYSISSSGGSPRVACEMTMP